MKKNIPTTLKQKAACMLMLIALVWLTVSIPFVYEFQKTFAKEKIAKNSSSTNDDSSSNNPLNNTTEEKSSNNSNTTLSEEYIHHATEELNHFSTGIIALHITHEATYTAFHGELLCPPPNA